MGKKLITKQITFRAMDDSVMGDILSFIKNTPGIDFDNKLNTVVRALYIVQALENKVSEKHLQQIARESIGTLQGYIDGIKGRAKLPKAPEHVIAANPYAVGVSPNQNVESDSTESTTIDDVEAEEAEDSTVERASQRMEQMDALFDI